MLLVGGGWKLLSGIGMYRNFARTAFRRDSNNGICKPVPPRLTLSTIMKRPPRNFPYLTNPPHQLLYHLRYISRRRRSCPLFCDHAQFISFSGEAQYGLDEVVAVHALYPGGAQDDVALPALAHGLFTGGLAGAVDVDGIVGVVFLIGVLLGAVEDVVGGDVYLRDIRPGASRGEMGRAITIHRVGLVRFGLGLVDGGVRGGIHHHVECTGRDHCVYRVYVGDVQFGALGTHRRHAEFFRATHELPTDLAVSAGHQYLGMFGGHGHQPVYFGRRAESISASRKPAASFADSCGSMRGHSMPMSGTFQRMLSSDCGV